MDRITILDDENVCFICGKEFKTCRRVTHNWKTQKYMKEQYPGMEEIHIVCMHQNCSNLVAKIEKAKDQLCNFEFQLFLKRYN
jgi:hypothetical protein